MLLRKKKSPPTKGRTGAGRFYRLYAKEPFAELGYFRLHSQVIKWAKRVHEVRNETVCVYTAESFSGNSLVAYFPDDDWEEVYPPLHDYYSKKEE